MTLPEMVRPAIRRRWGLLRLVLMVATALAVVGSLAFWPRDARPAVGTLRLDTAPRAHGPLRITGVETELLWRVGPTARVTIHVRNTSDHPVQGRVWWILADPGASRPWLGAALEAAPITVTVDPGQSKAVLVVAPLEAVKAGQYRLSLWVHTYDTSTHRWVHSDGRAMLGSLRLIDPVPGISHDPGGSITLWIHDASPMGAFRAGRAGLVRISVASGAPRGSVVQVWWFLARVGVEEPWLDPSAVRSATVTAQVDGAGLTTIDIPMQRLPAPGHYELSVWLHQSDARGSVHRDAVRLIAPVAVGAA